MQRTDLPSVVPAGMAHMTLRSLYLHQCARLGATVAYTVLADDLSVMSRITFADLESRVLPLASALASRCVFGDRIVLAFDNGLESVELFWACIVAGLVPIPAPAPAPRQFTEAGLKRLQGIAANSGAALVMVAADQLQKLTQPLPDSWISREALEVDSNPDLPDVVVGENDVAYLQYTSGSTSEPRGVELTHRNVLAHYAALDLEVEVNGALVSVLNWLPWYHDFGLLQGVISPIYTGVTSYLMPTLTFLFRPLSWLDAIAKYKISHSGAPDMAYRACVRALARKPHWNADLKSWWVATSGGEPVRADTIETFSRAFSPHGFRVQSFAPAYGLAEAVLAVSIKSFGATPRLLKADASALDFNRVEAGDGQAGSVRTLVGCGKPLDGIDVRIVDPHRRVELPSNAVGEIWVSGPTIGRGYWGKADLSEELFGARLASDGEVGQHFLRTGDLGFLHEGQIFVSGRLKDLILVGGRNLHPQDIEVTAQKAHQSVRDAAVVAFGIERQAGEAVVVLAECMGRPDPAEVEAIVEGIRREVSAEYGVEVYDVALLKRGSLPHTSSGKPQRASARRSYFAGEFASARHNSERAAHSRREPEDATERIVADAWMAVLDLDVERCDVDADFFLQGGNSLIATQLVSRLNAAFGADLPIRAVFEAPTIAGLARKLREISTQAEPRNALARPLEGSGRAAGYPLSFSQERCWFVSHQAPESTAYHMPLALRFKGQLNVAAFEAAFASVVERHEILRTTFQGTSAGVESRVHSTMPIRLRSSKLAPTISGSDSFEQALERHLAHLTQEPFDLERGPLLRAHIVELGPDDAVLLVVMHHIIGDQWSFAVLARELAHFYRARLGSETGSLAPLPLQYADFAAWQRQTFEGDRREREEDYWSAQLADMEPVALASDYPRLHRLLYRGAHVRVPFDSDLVARLTALGARYSASLSMVMMTALNVLLQRHTGRSDISIGVSIANRNHDWSEALIGTFVNVLMLRTDVDRKLAFPTLLERVRQAALDGFAHQEMPFDQLVKKLKHQRDASRAPLFQVLFNMINAPVGKLDFGGLQVSRANFDHQSAQFDLAVMVDAEHDFSICFEYAIQVFQPETIERFAAHYLKLLEEVARAESGPIAQLSMMDGAETTKLLELGRGTDFPLVADTVASWLRPAFAKWADKSAIFFEGEALSYQGLDLASERVAQALRQRRIGRGHKVGLYVARSTEMIAALLGVLKSGAAYVPLDPVNPVARLGYIARDAGLSLILVDSSGDPSPAWMGDIPTLGVDACATEDVTVDATAEGDASGLLDARADDPAYVLYTSGSTGEPKGVAVSHRSVVNLLSSVVVEPGLSWSDRVLAITTLSFDISIVETLLPLGIGASIALAGRKDISDGAALLRLIDAHKVSFVQATPSTWHLLLNAGWVGSPDLRKVVVTGEPLPLTLASDLVARCGEVWNMYGPTETTVWSTGGRVENPEGRGISIGRPLANTQVYVLDSDFQVCPIGVEGDMFVGGLGVSQGYVNLPDLTAERFLPDRFAPHDANARIYRTGDRARWRNDGTLVHLGRSDTQVKLRGYRIELSEIEAVLARHPQVVRAAVAVRDIAPGDTRLVAYVVPRGDVLTAGILGEYLSRFLPDYMLPQHIGLIDALPLLASGKVDSKALANITLHAPSSRAVTGPRSPDEQAVWEIWRDVLGVDNFGVYENFFDLGGHSMLAVRVVNRVQAELNATCAIPMLFQHPTIAELVAAMSGRPNIETPLLVALQELGETPPLFCICGIHLYQDLANHLAPHRQVYAIFVPCELGILNGEGHEDSFFMSVEEIAADYIREMHKKQPHGPYHLAGLSFGGLLAFEIAQQLRRKGEEVAFLVMFDTMMPMGRWQFAARKALDHARRLLRDDVSSAFARGRSLAAEIVAAARSDRDASANPMDIAHAGEARLTDLRDKIYLRSARRYKTRPYDGPVVLIRAEDAKIPDTTMLWRRIIKDLDVLSVPGDHLGILKAPYVGVVADHILARLRRTISLKRASIG